ncbi:MAG: hypothetical protein PHY45_11865 [Rhodocyclaceae bacterium]|nr:hypothetical protein [Rhodocyclaceae bacterium]
MSAPDISSALAEIEEQTKKIAAAINTLGQLLPTGMAVTVMHAPGLPASVAVVYPDGSISTKEYQAPSIH